MVVVVPGLLALVFGFGMPLGSEEAQAEALLWFLGNGGGYQNDAGDWTINSPQNAEALMAERLPGVVFRPARFRPTFQKWAGRVCGDFLPVQGSLR